jgi:hypothetical protein
MPIFQRVEDRKAGPNALGILVPPGRRTVVIVRPRALPWDLLAAALPAEAIQPLTFLDFDRDEAARVARGFHHDLEECAQNSNHPPEVKTNLWGAGYLVGIKRHNLFWLTCRREPGRSYGPMIWTSAEECQEVVRRLRELLCPEPVSRQEIYFNTQNFGTQLG